MTQPLFAGIISTLRNGNIRSQALDLGICLLFLGYGTGPIVFQYLLNFGLIPALMLLGLLEGALVILSIEHIRKKVFKTTIPKNDFVCMVSHELKTQ
jgi:hypothetical protein